MTIGRRIGLWLSLLGLAVAGGAVAAPLEPADAPAPLAPWVDWVLRGHERERCPFLTGRGGERPCVWPARLALELTDSGGRFRQEWLVHARSWVALPGNARQWPLDVVVDGGAAPVIERAGAPGIELAPGRHTVAGAFVWDALPELLQIPPQTGIVGLSLRGRPIAFPNRDAQGRLWLQKRRDRADGDESRLEVAVQRRVSDSIPLHLTTRIELEVAGSSREVVLGRALPEGFVPLALSGPIPVRLDPDGRLRAQVRPGTWHLVLEARHEGPVSELGLSEPGGPWDGDEVWVFAARPDLRLVTVEGGVSVDPQQTRLPAEWRSLPAYLMKPGSRLRFDEKRRGDSDPAPDRLSLQRTWWLDFAGQGYTVSDRMSGEIRRSSRLEMGPGTELGRVALGGRDQFITRRGESGTVGIEVPRGAIQLSADSRSPGRSAVPAVGWSQDFQELAGELHLPPGWRLFHASGVDQAGFTWVNRWTLLDFFVVLVIAMAFFRLWGPAWGGLALVTLALTYTESGAPHWVWVVVLVAEGLRRVLPAASRFTRVVRLVGAGALAALVLIAIAFSVTQIRIGLHPALERPYNLAHRPFPAPDQGMLGGRLAQKREAEEGFAAAADKIARLEAPASVPAEAPRGRVARRKGMLSSLPALSDYAPDPQARITTGPGLPSWQWTHVSLVWNGPVERDQILELWLWPPWWNGLLAFVRVGLLGLLIACAASGAIPSLRLPLQPPPAGAVGAALAALALWIGLGAAPARADMPSPELLSELRAALLEAPECHPQCATVSRLGLDVSPGELRARLEVDVAAPTAVPLPGSARGFTPGTVLVDGVPARALLRDRAGLLWVQLSPGRHQLVLSGRLPDRDTVELPLPLRPHRVEVTTRGWLLHGVHEDGLAEPNLQLSRLRDPASDSHSDELEAGELPPFVRVERWLRLGLRWQLETVVHRVSPADSALVLEVPLLAGESVKTAGIRVSEQRALVTMGPGITQVRWSSLLDEQAELRLFAPREIPWTEVWRLDVSPIWHVEASGIAVVHAAEPAGARAREWRPWPGEEVVLAVTRPAGVEGATATLDASTLIVTPGLRATDATLHLQIRSSRGGPHAIRLPEGAQLQSVKLAGREQPVRLDGRELRLPLTPGRQAVEVSWREPRGISARFVTPQVDLGLPSVNSEVRVQLPQGRWTLLTGGPRLGPAVLFWPLIVVLAGIAVLLSRIPWTPLRPHHWLLLALGLTQVPIPVAALVPAWLLALGWRRERGVELPGRWFSLAQAGIAALTALALFVLFMSIQRGLLGEPAMQIAGNLSSARLLRWYQDRVGSQLPQAWVLSVPLLVYRLAMLAWALWLAQALVRWLRWGWECFSAGELWRPLRPLVRRADAADGSAATSEG